MKIEYTMSLLGVGMFLGCSWMALHDERWNNIRWLPFTVIAICLLAVAGMIVEYLENREMRFLIGLPEPTRPKARPSR